MLENMEEEVSQNKNNCSELAQAPGTESYQNLMMRTWHFQVRLKKSSVCSGN